MSHHPRGRRLPPARALAACAAIALAVPLAFGCGRPSGPGGPAVEREESVAGNRVRLESRIQPKRVTLGDRAVWSLGAELGGPMAAGQAVRDSADSNLDVSVREPARAVRREGGVRWTFALDVRGFTLGAIALPAVRLPVSVGSQRDTLVFPPDTLFVDSLTQAGTGALQPDRGPVPTELRPIDIAVAIAAGLVVIAALVWIVRAIRSALRRRRGLEEATPSAPPEPPETVFRRELERLRGEAATLPRDRFYDGLSAALRAYAASTTRIPALDLTTSELTRELRRDHRVDEAGATLLVRTLRRSDLAKFARQEDPLAEARAALEEAASLAGRLLRPTLESAPGVSAPPTAPPVGKEGG